MFCRMFSVPCIIYSSTAWCTFVTLHNLAFRKSRSSYPLYTTSSSYPHVPFQTDSSDKTLNHNEHFRIRHYAGEVT